MPSLRESLINALGGVKRPDAPVLPALEGGMLLPELPQDVQIPTEPPVLPEQEMVNSGQFTPDEFRNITVSGAEGQPLTTVPETKPEFKDSFLGKFLKGAGNALGEEMAASTLGPSMGRAIAMLTGGNVNLVPSRKPEDLFKADFNALTAPQQEFVTKNYGTGATLASKTVWDKTPTEAINRTIKITEGLSSLDSAKKDIQWAIKNKDLGTFSTAINTAIGVNSVMNDQGVVSDPEAARILSTVQENIRTMEKTGADFATVTRFFNSDLWKSAENILATMENNAKSRIRNNIALFPQLGPEIARTGLNIETAEDRGLDPEKAISKQQRDAAAIAETYIAQNVKTAGDLEKGKAFFKNLKGQTGILGVVGEIGETLLGEKKQSIPTGKTPSATTPPPVNPNLKRKHF